MTSTIDAPPAVASAAGDGRAAFVDAVLNDFVERTGTSVADTVREFILDDVLVPDEQWDAALRDERLDTGQVYEILTEALSVSADRTEQSRPDAAQEPAAETAAVADRSLAAGAFRDVIEGRWHCPFPFIFC